MPFEINSVNNKAMSCIQVTLSRVRELMAAAAVIVSDRAVILSVSGMGSTCYSVSLNRG